MNQEDRRHPPCHKRQRSRQLTIYKQHGCVAVVLSKQNAKSLIYAALPCAPPKGKIRPRHRAFGSDRGPCALPVEARDVVPDGRATRGGQHARVAYSAVPGPNIAEYINVALWGSHETLWECRPPCDHATCGDRGCRPHDAGENALGWNSCDVDRSGSPGALCGYHHPLSWRRQCQHPGSRHQRWRLPRQ